MRQLVAKSESKGESERYFGLDVQTMELMAMIGRLAGWICVDDVKAQTAENWFCNLHITNRQWREPPFAERYSYKCAVFGSDVQVVEHTMYGVLPAASQDTRQKYEELEARVLQLESRDEHVEPIEERITVEQETENILREKAYERLRDVLASDRETVLDMLCRKTAAGDISLKTEDGKQIWRSVIQFYLAEHREQVNLVYSRLAECSRNGFLGGVHQFIYDTLFAVSGGVTADVDSGYWAADKYAKYILSRKLFKQKSKATRAI